jgi:SAM-dependent methyltransferase
MQVDFVAERSACPVCDGPPVEQAVLFTKQQATFVRCRNCAFVFINPRPSAAWLAARYEYYGTAYFTNPDKLASDFHSTRHDAELALLHGLSGRLLDVGCATGSFVAAARTAGFDARGIDISPESTRYGREVLGLALDVGDLYERRYPPETFDIVTLWATLEHLPDPNRFLSEARRLLVPGGRIAISVPNRGSLAQRILGRLDRYVGIDHVNYFSRSTTCRILNRHGLSIETVRTAGFSPVVFWQDLRGSGSNGASVERQLADQQVTDRFKYGGGIAAAARAAHTGITRVLGAAGLGDILYVVGRKPVTE